MTGADIIAVIILIGLAIAIGVYLLHWLYRRSSKEVSFVRTGLGGEKVVISGGAFVLPIIHNVTTVGMRTLRIEVRQAGERALITSNRMRVDVTAEFYVRVTPNKEAVSTAAQSLGSRTMDPEGLRELVQGRFVDALGNVAAKMSMDEMQENRGEYIKNVKGLVEETLRETGLEIEAVSLTGFDQAALEVFNPSNAFDAEGLTQLTEQIETRKKKRNDIEQDTAISIRNKNLEAEKMALEIDRDSEYSRLAQEREIAKQRAKESAEIAAERAAREKEAEEAQIRSEEAVEIIRISRDQAIEVERSLREHKLTLEIEERRQKRNEVEKDTEIKIERKNLEAEVEALNIARDAEYARLKQQEEIAVQRAQQKADVVKEEMDRYREAESSRITAQEDVKKLEISQQQAIDQTRIENEEKVRAREIEKRKQLELEEKQREIVVTEKSMEVLKKHEEEELVRAKAVEAEEKVLTTREMEAAERDQADRACPCRAAIGTRGHPAHHNRQSRKSGGRGARICREARLTRRQAALRDRCGRQAVAQRGGECPQHRKPAQRTAHDAGRQARLDHSRSGQADAEHRCHQDPRGQRPAGVQRRCACGRRRRRWNHQHGRHRRWRG